MCICGGSTHEVARDEGEGLGMDIFDPRRFFFVEYLWGFLSENDFLLVIKPVMEA